jgi:methionyl-tRNA formyltransferase
MKSVVVFISRTHGLEILDALIDSKNYEIIQVYTHKLNPKSQDSTRSIRNDFHNYLEKCNENNIKLITIDSPKKEIDDFPNCDFIIEVSWRYLIQTNITNKAKISAFGIHRGKLPEYAGAEPIKQALQKGEKEIVISSHYLAPKIDGGAVIFSERHPVNYNPKNDLEANIQRLRDEITPLFSKIMFKTLEILGTNSTK